jgi:hypothetical protein
VAAGLARGNSIILCRVAEFVFRSNASENGLYALDFEPDLRPGADKGELERALEGHTMAWAS